MKKLLSIFLSAAIFCSALACLSGIIGIAENSSDKNYPLPKGYVLKTVSADCDELTSDYGEGENCYGKSGKSKKFNSSTGNETAVLTNLKLDGVGFMFWYKSAKSFTVRMRWSDGNAGPLLMEATVPACENGQWAQVYYRNRQNNISLKSDADKYIDKYIDANTKQNPNQNYTLDIMWLKDTDIYLDEFLTFDVPTTAADSYDENDDETAYKFSLKKMCDTSYSTDQDYYEDGSAELYSLKTDTEVETAADISYNIDREQFRKAVRKANKGSGFLQVTVDNENCPQATSGNSDIRTKFKMEFRDDGTSYSDKRKRVVKGTTGLDKQLVKYSVFSNESNTYLIKVSDLDDETIDKISDIHIVFSRGDWTNLKNAKVKVSPITVFNYPNDETIVQAEDMNPKFMAQNGVEDAVIQTVKDDDNNRTYATRGGYLKWMSFELPNFESGEYEVYAYMPARQNDSRKYEIAVNNLRQQSNVILTDDSYKPLSNSRTHDAKIYIGKIKITKNYSDGPSILKFVPTPQSERTTSSLSIDYFGFKKTSTEVTTEPSSNFEIKEYPVPENYHIDKVLETYDDFIFSTESRWYQDSIVAGYVGNGTAYNLNSRCTYNSKGGLGDSNWLWSGKALGNTCDGIRFWYKSSVKASIRFGGENNRNVWYSGIAANPEGGWVTIYAKDVQGGDLSWVTNLRMSCASVEMCVDEIHTIEENAGELTYKVNSDNQTASVSGHNLRIEDVTVNATYKDKPVTSVSENALQNILSLRSVTFPDSLVSVESGAFSGDRNLSNVKFGNKLSTIGANAFKDCSSLGEIKIPQSVSSIDKTAFDGCTNLILDVTNNAYAKQYAIDNGLNYRCANADYDYYKIGSEIHINKYLGNAENVVLPEKTDNLTVTEIMPKAFLGNSTLKSVKSATVTKIGESAFDSCLALDDANLPKTVTVGDKAFNNCTALKNADLGDKLETIGSKAFANDKSLVKIKLPETVTKIENDAFENRSDDIVADVVRPSYAYEFVNVKETAMKQVYSEGEYTYSVYRKDASIIGYTGNASSLAIPATIDSEYKYPVIAVGENTFKNNKKLTYVSFSDKCKKIYKSAFEGCSNLQNFDINKITYIDHRGFAYCTSLKNITLTNILKYEDDTFLGCNVNISTVVSQFGRSAMDLTNSWHMGINYGNRFDWACDTTRKYIEDDTARKNCIPKTTDLRERFKFYANSGYDVIRLPVSWFAFTKGKEDNYAIDPDYMAAVKQAVDYAIAENLYIVINVHHDTIYWLNLKNYGDEVRAKYQRIWEQISECFKDYDEHLIFESLNEERYEEEWDPRTAGAEANFNELQKLFYKVVRNSGGYNNVRYLMLETYAAQAKESHCKNAWVPSKDEDDHIMMSLHHYDGRAGEDYNNWNFGFGKKYFVDKGIPCTIGETGCQRMNIYDTNHKYTQEQYDNQNEYLYEWTNGVLKAGENQQCKVFIWEDGGSFGMVNHSKIKWDFPLEALAVLEHSRPNGPYTAIVDGVTLAMNDDGTVTMPSDIEDGKVGFSDGVNFFEPGERVTLSKHLNLQTTDKALSKDNRATIVTTATTATTTAATTTEPTTASTAATTATSATTVTTASTTTEPTTSTQPTVIIGDTDGDGTVTTSDVLKMNQYLASMSVKFDYKAADINGDGVVDTVDVLILTQHLAGISVPPWNK